MGPWQQTECTKCYNTEEFVDRECIPFRDGFMSNGTVCKSVPTLGSVTVELTDETYSASKIIEEIRIIVEKETGCNAIISVIYSNDISG